MHKVEIDDLCVEFAELNGVIAKISIQAKSKRALNGTDLRKVRTPILLRLITPSKKPNKATPRQWRLQLAVDLIRKNPYESPTKVVSKALSITPASASNLLTRARKAGILID
jgi:hypothetical protein